ncbi:MAG: YjbQ family protein [Parcubacteria group bacterium]|nr:YjbQ family protein [Parcubacteria group bacterium]
MKITISTKGHNDIIDITDKVAEKVKESKVEQGIVLVFVPHQTCAISVLEYEPGLIQDLKDLLNKIAPLKGDYEHNKAWGDGNGAAHLLASLIKPDLTVPLENNHLILGTWQKIILLDFDNRACEREVNITIIAN